MVVFIRVKRKWSSGGDFTGKQRNLYWRVEIEELWNVTALKLGWLFKGTGKY